LIHTTRGIEIGSDSTLKQDIEDINDPLIKVLQLHGVLFNFKEPNDTIDTITFQDKQGNWHTVIPSQLPNIDPSLVNDGIIERLIEDRDRKHMGLIAQEVELVVPEVVRMTPNGTLAVEYFGLIGLLIEAIKEQQIEIDSLKEQKFLKYSNSTGENSSTIKENNILYQNVPNPFNQNTVICFKIATGTKMASILIFDMQGSLLKTYNVSNSVEKITIFRNEFNPGMYLYSLIVDGVEIDTKRMILTD
jgi:hypothetical protein